MSDVVQIYTLLSDACAALDAANDHAIAAYVGLAMALMEEKYDIVPSDITGQASGNGANDTQPPPKRQENGGSWA